MPNSAEKLRLSIDIAADILCIFRIPFDWQNPMGYAIFVLMQWATVYCMMAFGAYPTMCLYIGSCWMIKTIVNDISNDLAQLNVKPSTAKDRLKKKAFFCDIIRNISEAKQLSRTTDADLSSSLLLIKYLNIRISFKVCE